MKRSIWAFLSTCLVIAATSASAAMSGPNSDAAMGGTSVGGGENRLAGPPHLWSARVKPKDHDLVGIAAPYIPLAACRLVDTRGLFSPIYAGGAYAANEVRTYVLSGNACGIPADAEVLAAALQVIVPPPAAAGDLEILPSLGTFGSTVAMVFEAGKWNSVSVTAKVNSLTNNIDVQVRGTAGHVVIDLVGYYADGLGTGTEMYVHGTPSANLAVLNADLEGAVAGTAAITATSNTAGVDLATAGGSAVDIFAGDLRVRNAGLNTNTAAFIHTVNTATDLCPNANFARMNNAMINANPNALIFITGVGGIAGNTAGPSTTPVTLYYTSCVTGGGWAIYSPSGHVNASRYTILVIKP